MKRLLTISLGILVLAGAARGDCIGIYADTRGLECHLNLVQFPGTNSLYIVHQLNANGTMASQFKVEDASGLFPTSQTSPYLTIGTWNTDLSIAYGSCVLGDHVLMTLNFYWFGNAIIGCGNTLGVAPAPTSPIPGQIVVVNCLPSHDPQPAYSGRDFYVQSVFLFCIPPCGCGDFHISVDAATWGSVKALYR